MLVDSHCHLHMLPLDDFQNDMGKVIHAAKENGVGYFLNVCTQLCDVPTIMDIARAYPMVWGSVGIHPNEPFEGCAGEGHTAKALLALATDDKCIAIGETGLDYFRTDGKKARSEQQQRFIEHIEVAQHLRIPLIVHSRQAPKDTIAILRDHNARHGVMHCFCEDWATAKAAIECGFYISFSGIVTFKNAQNLQEVATKVPLSRLLVETDAPYLAPVPYRGKSNQPAYVRYTAEKIATLRGISYEAVANATTENFFTCFSLAKRCSDE